MQIIHEPQYDFSDVLILPKRSMLTSRNDVILSRNFTFMHSSIKYSGFPVIVSNMNTTGTFTMANGLKKYNMSVSLHKHYDAENLINFFKENGDYPTFYSIGMKDSDIEKLNKVKEEVDIKWLLLDIPNGYMEKFPNFVKKIRKENKNAVIMAGNVVTGDMTQELLISGADIVKVGIGSGCVAGDSRILMANGKYKDIVDINIGDRVINMHGKNVLVKNVFYTGVKKVLSIKNNSFYDELKITPEHICYLGDVSKETSVIPFKKILEKKRTNNIEWRAISTAKNTKSVGLIPTNIEWDLPNDISININNFAIRKIDNEKYKEEIKSNYALGYIFGFFLGDGSARVDTHSETFWTLNVNDKNLEKLCDAIQECTGKKPSIKQTKNVNIVFLYSRPWARLFCELNKKTNKELPLKYMCKNKEYLMGLYDGLLNSDGCIYKDTNRHFFGNTAKPLIELFNFLCLNIYGYLPANNPGTIKPSMLKEENRMIMSKEKYYTITHTPGGQISKRVLDSGLQAIKILSITEKDIEIPVYDLEIDDDTHSFIANNMIIHNSVCTTRKITGVGRPQLSTIIEAADVAHGLGGHICGDGGLILPGDFGKGFGAGADFLMAGGIFAGHDECEGQFIYGNNAIEKGAVYSHNPDLAKEKGQNIYFNVNDDNFYILKSDEWVKYIHTPTHMKFHGMSSSQAMNKHNGGIAEYRASEGKEVLVPYRGPVENTVKEILGGVRSTCTYTGAKTLKELPKRTTFIVVNRTHNTVFGE